MNRLLESVAKSWFALAFAKAISAVATADNSQLYQLAITLSVRNTDRTLPIVITAIRYHHGAAVSDTPDPAPRFQVQLSN